MVPARILVVEDTELLRRMYRDRLTQDGYEVVEVADGLAALSVLRDQLFDLILLDLVMPRMGGVEVLDVIKHTPRIQHIPVIVLTNLGEEATIDHAVSLGAIDCLIKNETRPGDVSEKVRTVLSAITPPEKLIPQFNVHVRADEGDVDALAQHAGLKRRLWCPACEEELMLELTPDAKRPGWYNSRFVCPSCARNFSGLADAR